MKGNNRFNGIDRQLSEESIHTIISYVLGVTATIVMFYLGIRHFNDVDEYGRAWGKFALMHGVFGFVGMLGIRMTSKNNGFFPKFRKINMGSTLITAVVVMGVLLLTQVIFSKFVLEVTATEQALYTVFSAVTEELFFRATICYVLIFPIYRNNIYSINSRLSGKPNPSLIVGKIVTAVFSGVIFGISHVNYQGTYLVYAISISGIIMGLWFSFFHASFLGEPDKGYDLTGMMLGHFLLNLITVGKWIITLS